MKRPRMQERVYLLLKLQRKARRRHRVLLDSVDTAKRLHPASNWPVSPLYLSFQRAPQQRAEYRSEAHNAARLGESVMGEGVVGT